MQLFVHAAFTVASYIIEQRYVHAQDSESNGEFDLTKSIDHAAEYTDVFHMHNQTFVALIDIVFTDVSKRTCTGTIIHDNVVVTARHCFGKTHNKFIQPEITASFVVIGSKKLFESGYEQYLPIERIISHPKYRGWKADIALVYTFAGMMSDKPGTILPLAGAKISLPKHYNITIFSWGRNKDVDSEKENYSDDQKRNTEYLLRANNLMINSEETLTTKRKAIKNSKTSRLYTKASHKLKVEKTKRNKIKNHGERYKKHSSRANRVTDGVYRSQTSLDENIGEGLEESDESENHDKVIHDVQKRYGPIKNWRRSMGSEKNELSIGNFKVVNMETCEEIIKKGLPEKYSIKNYNEYICYSSDHHFVTDEDAGAPAVFQGHLVAVTVGGVECDGEHVAVGIKISCFCPWIADNLPDGGNNFECCDTHCCDEENPSTPDQDEKDVKKLRFGKKKKI